MADNLETSEIIVQDGQGNNQLVQAVRNLSGTIIWDEGIKTALCVVEDENGDKQLALKTVDIGGGGGSATWGSITGTLSNQTDLQDALNSKIGIVDGELKVSNGDNIVVEVEDDSKTEIFSDSMSITADGQDSNEATISLNGVNGSILNLTDGSNTIDLKTNATDGATITKTENNTTKNVLWEGEALQNTATGTDSLTILGTPTSYSGTINIGTNNNASWSQNTISIGNSSTTYGSGSIVIGDTTRCEGGASVVIGSNAKSGTSYTTTIGSYANCASTGGSIKTAIGSYAYASGEKSIAIGCGNSLQTSAQATAQESIQLGSGTNSTARTLQVYNYTLLDGNTGKIPSARLPANIDYVVEMQLPTSSNNYTWYRKYKSGWVEQGGRYTLTNQGALGETITLPVEMADTNYSVITAPLTNGDNWPFSWSPLSSWTTTTINIDGTGNYTTAQRDITIQWEVKGQSNTNE